MSEIGCRYLTASDGLRRPVRPGSSGCTCRDTFGMSRLDRGAERPEASMRSSDDPGAFGNRDVVVRSLENFASVAVVGGDHSVVIDEPREVQGYGLAPNPFGLILSALGGCIAGTVRGVARQHDFDYANAEVRLRLRVNRPTYGPLDPGERELRIAKIKATVTIRRELTHEHQELLWHGVGDVPGRRHAASRRQPRRSGPFREAGTAPG